MTAARFPPVLFLFGVLGLGCVRQELSPVLLPSYRATSPVVLDGRLNEKGWKGGYPLQVECIVEGKQYNRHYVWSMHDGESLYLAVRTSYHSGLLTKRCLYHAAERVDTFPLKILSDDREVVRVLIASDGSARTLHAARPPATREEAEDEMRRECGLRVSATVDEAPDRRKGSMLWFSEIKIPLGRLRPLGHQLWVDVSGKRGRLWFYPELGWR